MIEPSGLDELLCDGASPHHNLHVFALYPWVALLRAGRALEPLRVLEKCRIRWGQVQERAGDDVTVAGQGLAWEGGSLLLGPPRTETVAWRKDGHALMEAPLPGQWVAMHWDWVCDVISDRQLLELQGRTASELATVNQDAPATS